MSREIKFRARWEDTGKEIPDFMNEYTLESLNSDSLIIEQFTGLKDKNGAEIYEGDIFVKQGRAENVVIAWDNESSCFGYYENSTFGRIWRSNCYGQFQECEIIGNIYENPELLKEGKAK